MRAIVFAACLSVPAVVQAQEPATPVPVATPDPARVAAADRLLDVMMPPAPREKMVYAMARAYARTFTDGQLAELERFFRTPTGRAYTTASTTIMTDPEVAAFQRRMTMDALAHMRGDLEAFVKETAATQQDEKK